MDNNVGKFIYNLRKSKGLTQQDLAQELHVTFQAVSKWENGKSIPDILILQDISKKFNVDISEILENKKKKKKINPFFVVIPTLTIFIIIISLIIVNIDNSFEFKTIATDNEYFNVTGSLAYSKDKSTMYISSIELDEKIDEEYKVVTCTLYELHEEIETQVQTCDYEGQETLSNLLKQISFYIDDININCSHGFYIKIKAMNDEGKVVNYEVPLKMDNYCKE